MKLTKKELNLIIETYLNEENIDESFMDSVNKAKKNIYQYLSKLGKAHGKGVAAVQKAVMSDKPGSKDSGSSSGSGGGRKKSSNWKSYLANTKKKRPEKHPHAVDMQEMWRVFFI